MLPHILAFLGVALFPSALAAFGIYLTTETIIDPKKRLTALLVFWALAIDAIVAVGLQQVSSYKADIRNEEKQSELQGKLDKSLLGRVQLGGELDNISVDAWEDCPGE